MIKSVKDIKSTDPTVINGIDLTNVSANELEKAVTGVQSEGNQEISPLEITTYDFELSNLCEPDEVTIPADFSDNEIIDASCEPNVTIPKIPPALESAPINFPNPSIDTEVTLLTDPDSEILSKLAELLSESLDSPLDPLGNLQREGLISDKNLSGISTGGSGTITNPSYQTIPVFDSNGPSCFTEMTKISEDVKKIVNDYKDAKTAIQEIQTDYFYYSLLNTFYSSFDEGYDKQKNLQNELLNAKTKQQKDEIANKIQNLPKNNPLGKSRKTAQDEISKITGKFSSQIVIRIDPSISKYPSLTIDKSKEVTGDISDIPNRIKNDVNSKIQDDPTAINDVKDIANKGTEDLQNSFEKTMKDLGIASSSFGYNEFLKGTKRTNEFKTAKTLALKNYKEIKEKYDELKKKEDDSEEALSNINSEINSRLSKLGCNPRTSPVPTAEAGADLNMKNVSTNPTIFDHAWWVKFCKLASIVNLVPLHWPVGLLIPTPAYLLKIPFPIIWFPLFVIGTSKSISVILIGQCGILPSPFLFTQHFLNFPVGPFISNNPYFIIGMRGPVGISSHSPLFVPSMPSFSLLLTIMNIALDRLRKNLSVDYLNLYAEAQNSVKGIDASANAYAASQEKVITDTIQNAEKQASQIKDTAQKEADKQIADAQKQAQQETDNARKQYGNSDKYYQQSQNIQRALEQKINTQRKRVADASKQASKVVADAKLKAATLRDNAQQSLQAKIDAGKKEFNKKLESIKKLETQEQEKLDELRTLVSMVQTPQISIDSINTPALLNSFSLSLGSVKALGADLSPKVNNMNFLSEISPNFSSLLPMLTDEFPTWERLSLENIPFLLFLWKWCSAGKETGGFFRDPF